MILGHFRSQDWFYMQKKKKLNFSVVTQQARCTLTRTYTSVEAFQRASHRLLSSLAISTDEAKAPPVLHSCDVSVADLPVPSYAFETDTTSHAHGRMSVPEGPVFSAFVSSNEMLVMCHILSIINGQRRSCLFSFMWTGRVHVCCASVSVCFQRRFLHLAVSVFMSVLFTTTLANVIFSAKCYGLLCKHTRAQFCKTNTIATC